MLGEKSFVFVKALPPFLRKQCEEGFDTIAEFDEPVVELRGGKSFLP